MDMIAQLGELAFGSRLRRITHVLMSDATEIYKYNQVDFQPKWFPAFYYLNEIYPNAAGVTEIAKGMGVTHPLVNRFANELIKIGYVEEVTNEDDKRKRQIMLSDKGRQLAQTLRPIWDDIELSIREVICAADPQMMHLLNRLEDRIQARGLFDTYRNRAKSQAYETIHIRMNDPNDFIPFKTINLEWLYHYFKDAESHDMDLLDHPQQIIQDGGFIFSASLDDEVLGVCALIKLDDTSFELSKMGVCEKARGKQIGRKLLDMAIARAREIGAKAIYLETNNQLKSAIQLYQKNGFEFTHESHTGASAYQKANVFMRLTLP